MKTSSKISLSFLCTIFYLAAELLDLTPRDPHLLIILSFIVALCDLAIDIISHLLPKIPIILLLFLIYQSRGQEKAIRRENAMLQTLLDQAEERVKETQNIQSSVEEKHERETEDGDEDEKRGVRMPPKRPSEGESGALLPGHNDNTTTANNATIYRQPTVAEGEEVDEKVDLMRILAETEVWLGWWGES
ncbi:hypothetical protein ABW19_dt0207563 [Dactylella cylindrospora]|nr:hypothetical protein ABW19_dt0207563 [Dactylella cylindrospora]